MKRLLTTSSSSRRIHRRLARRARRGFTLVELMISLVMGLIIALAAIALAKSSTTAFHEQARMSGVEMTLRAASERFRADLMKASYMSTPNIHLDRRIARIPGAPPNYRVPALLDLQGLYVDVGAGQIRTQGTLNLATRLENSGGGGSPLAPDDVYIAGNMTSDDMYRGQWVDVGSCPGAGARLRLSGLADPAVLRMYNGALAGPDQVKAAQAVFTPGERMTPPVLNKQYAVQVMDMRGCFHYLTVCAVSQGNDPNSVFVDLQGAGANSILTPDDTKDTCGGRLMEEFSIAPVSRVKWYLSSQDEHMVSPAPDPRLIDKVLDTPNGPGTASNKFNLYRQLLAADGIASVGPSEVVAEYAIDLKLGLVVDDLVAPVPGNHNIAYHDMEGAAANITSWTKKASTTLVGMEGPQRIRSVRYRMAFRAPLYDREAALPTTQQTILNQPYLARYCIGPTTPQGCKQWSRVRTVISEVALLNQERVFF